MFFLIEYLLPLIMILLILAAISTLIGLVSKLFGASPSVFGPWSASVLCLIHLIILFVWARNRQIPIDNSSYSIIYIEVVAYILVSLLFCIRIYRKTVTQKSEKTIIASDKSELLLEVQRYAASGYQMQLDSGEQTIMTRKPSLIKKIAFLAVLPITGWIFIVIMLSAMSTNNELVTIKIGNSV